MICNALNNRERKLPTFGGTTIKIQPYATRERKEFRNIIIFAKLIYLGLYVIEVVASQCVIVVYTGCNQRLVWVQWEYRLKR